ncbi:MAG: hypothetical protein SFY70_08110 [Bacteroidia bacterium]|nr:hypothetical protein [Bacteroidia bacterium]
MTAGFCIRRVGAIVVGLLLVVAGGRAQSLQPEPKPAVWGEYSEAELAMTRYEKDTNAHAVFLYDYGKMNVVFSTQSTILIQVHRRIKFLDDVALADLGILREGGAKFDLSLQRFEAKVVNVVNGEVMVTDLGKESLVREKFTNNVVVYKASFPELKAGSILEYRYQKEIGIGNVLSLPPWVFQHDYPVLFSHWEGKVAGEFELRIIPEGLPLSFQKAVNGNPVGSNNIYDFVLHHIPAFYEEPMVVGIDNYRSKLNILFIKLNNAGTVLKFFGTWPDLASAMGEGLETLLVGSSIKKKTKELIGDQIDKMKIISSLINFVSVHVKWDNEYVPLSSVSPSNGLEGKGLSSGLKNLLLLSMLRAADIKAHPVLIRLRQNGPLNTSYPVPYQLNHLIVAVEQEDGYLFLDATHPYHPPLELPLESMGSAGVLLDLSNKTYQIVGLPQPAKTTFNLSLTGKLSLDSARATGTFSTRIQGVYANTMRRLIAQDSAKSAIQEFVFDGDTTLQFSDYTVEGLEDPAVPLLISGKFSVPVQLEELEGEFYFTPTLLKTHAKNPFTSSVRLLPVTYNFMRLQNYTAILELPEGYSLVAPLRTKTIVMDEDKSMMFKRIGQQQERNIFFTTSLGYNKLVFLPEEYPDLKSFFDYVAQLQAEQFVIRPN